MGQNAQSRCTGSTVPRGAIDVGMRLGQGQTDIGREKRWNRMPGARGEGRAEMGRMSAPVRKAGPVARDLCCIASGSSAGEAFSMPGGRVAAPEIRPTADGGWEMKYSILAEIRQARSNSKAALLLSGCRSQAERNPHVPEPPGPSLSSSGILRPVRGMLIFWEPAAGWSELLRPNGRGCAVASPICRVTGPRFCEKRFGVKTEMLHAAVPV